MSGRSGVSTPEPGPASQAVRRCGRVAEPFSATGRGQPAMAGNTAPLRRHLLAGLRDAHAAGSIRLPLLRRCAEATATPRLQRLLLRATAEAEEQLHRLDHAFASLRDVAGGGQPGAAADASAEMRRLLQGGAPGAGRDAALAACIGRDLARAAEAAGRLRLLADAAGLHRIARLLDITTGELRAVAADCGRFAVQAG